MQAWGMLRQLLAVMLCALLVVPAYSYEKTPTTIQNKHRERNGYSEIFVCVVGSTDTYDYDAFGNLIHRSIALEARRTITSSPANSSTPTWACTTTERAT